MVQSSTPIGGVNYPCLPPLIGRRPVFSVPLKTCVQEMGRRLGKWDQKISQNILEVRCKVMFLFFFFWLPDLGSNQGPTD